MYALVLTFDKYKALAQHMIMCYAELWPDNPFLFRIPYQSESVKAEYESLFGNKVELIKSPSGIVDTMFVLFGDLNDNEWVYWCMDDRYPISINLSEVKKGVSLLETGYIDGLVFCHRASLWTPDHIFMKHFRINFNKQIYYRRRDYKIMWTHQFLHVSVIRKFFSLFPINMKEAKEMDYIKNKAQLPENQFLYLLDHNATVFGESTSRGVITKNCAESFKQKGLTLPEGFEVSDNVYLKGTDTKWDDYICIHKYYIKRILFHCSSSIRKKKK